MYINLSNFSEASSNILLSASERSPTVGNRRMVSIKLCHARILAGGQQCPCPVSKIPYLDRARTGEACCGDDDRVYGTWLKDMIGIKRCTARAGGFCY
jgi:hypothetical protein